ncbi:aspartate--tRNA ligase [Paenibacillus polymyxa]|uniref:aspartate--tRNA ligase n=1 Tax=Paenibacillus polymyxa TaxID=1406 RepID=UPI0025B6D3EE|nr:aspartate--tRNA ligase [Paenibacillus polymyxa]MDN4088227.1 aspartate--tRNA ligase [Paenibacillus polymyxa]
MHRYRTHNCGELNQTHVGEIVRIAGWVKNIRNLGGIVFIDLRDHYGVTQIVVSDPNELKDFVSKINRESTISVIGAVCHRSESTISPHMKTGYIEVIANEIEVLGKVMNPLPFEVSSAHEAREDLRLKYRFLDLRNEKLHDNIVLRSKVIQSIRKKMIGLDFLEIQTPILTSSSPEGARDYLVPSRVHPGQFYALPQAPQQFKQLLMVSGFDKYFQIAPCFRDEDARADRSPGEFYQLDLEMAFATQEDVFNVVENMLYEVFSEFTHFKISKPFSKIPYQEAMLKYGSDKPDLRNPLIIHDVTELFTESDFKVFKNKTIRVIATPGCEAQPRSFYDDIVNFAMEAGAKGLSWIKFNDDMSLSGSIAKFIPEKVKNELINVTQAGPGYALFFAADELKNVEKIAGAVRNQLGKRLDLLEKDTFRFCWIVDFPMFELDPDTQKIEFSHNPFSMPQGGMEALLNMNPLDILAYQYDIVCNGIELSSGAVRNHDTEIMVKAFEIAGYTYEEIKSKFPALFNAFQFGAPPHAGIAPGIDRIVMILANESNIREVIAFPMNSKAQDVLMGAPSEVTDKQLRDVHIKLANAKPQTE